jgi:anti-sigma factor RsiW
MVCKELETLILEYFENTLSAEDRRLVDDHIELCTGCHQFYNAQKSIDESLSLRLVPPSLSGGFRQQLMRRVALRSAERRLSYLPEILDCLGCAGVAAAAGILLVHFLPSEPLLVSWTLAAGSLLAALWLALADGVKREFRSG